MIWFLLSLILAGIATLGLYFPIKGVWWWFYKSQFFPKPHEETDRRKMVNRWTLKASAPVFVITTILVYQLAPTQPPAGSIPSPYGPAAIDQGAPAIRKLKPIQLP